MKNHITMAIALLLGAVVMLAGARANAAAITPAETAKAANLDSALRAGWHGGHGGWHGGFHGGGFHRFHHGFRGRGFGWGPGFFIGDPYYGGYDYDRCYWRRGYYHWHRVCYY